MNKVIFIHLLNFSHWNSSSGKTLSAFPLHQVICRTPGFNRSNGNLELRRRNTSPSSPVILSSSKTSADIGITHQPVNLTNQHRPVIIVAPLLLTIEYYRLRRWLQLSTLYRCIRRTVLPLRSIFSRAIDMLVTKIMNRDAYL